MSEHPTADPALDLEGEEWRPFPDFECNYEVSNFGRVRSLTRVVESSSGARRRIPGRTRKSQYTPRGYSIITLCMDGAQITKSVHAAVARAFIGPRPPGMHVAHNDGNPKNNHVSNLRYATPSENERDKLKHGTNPHASKTHCPQGHPYEGDNIKWEGSSRKCRTCCRAWSHEYAASGRRNERRKPEITEGRRIREWARSQGLTVANTGRLAPAIRAAYAEAHAERLVSSVEVAA